DKTVRGSGIVIGVSTYHPGNACTRILWCPCIQGFGTCTEQTQSAFQVYPRCIVYFIPLYPGPEHRKEHVFIVGFKIKAIIEIRNKASDYGPILRCNGSVIVQVPKDKVSRFGGCL